MISYYFTYKGCKCSGERYKKLHCGLSFHKSVLKFSAVAGEHLCLIYHTTQGFLWEMRIAFLKNENFLALLADAWSVFAIASPILDLSSCSILFYNPPILCSYTWWIFSNISSLLLYPAYETIGKNYDFCGLIFYYYKCIKKYYNY